MATDEIKEQVLRAQGGDMVAFSGLVRRYQAMAVAYAYAVLGDFHLAEDAAQEAFVDAHRLLGDLRRAEAFPGWLKRIVFKHCDRLSRRRPQTVGLEGAAEPLAAGDPAQDFERSETRRQVLRAIGALPLAQRQVVSLFYVQRHAQSEIAAFLELPLTTVKKRLHDARRTLKERMLQMVSDTLSRNSPDELFSQKVIAGLRRRPRPLQVAGHPVRLAWDRVRAALPAWEVVQGEEEVETALYESVQREMDAADTAYRLDGGKILRTHTTHTLFQAIKGRAAPLYLLTTGRCFRPDEEDGRHQKVFHQLDGLCIDTAARLPALEDTVGRVLQAVLGPVSVRWRARDFGFVEGGREFDVEVRGRREEVGGCGRLKPRMLRQAGYDADAVGGYAFGLGLERLVMLERGIDDIRSLWKEPYIEGGA